MSAQAYVQLQKRYGGKFVASRQGRVIATAPTSKDLLKKVARYVGDPRLLVQYIAPRRAVCTY